MNGRLKRFFIICAVTAAAGLVLFIAGFAAGGMDSLAKLTEKYPWIHVGAGPMKDVYLGKNAEFHSIKVRGDIDVTLCSGDKSKTCIEYGENYTPPAFYVEDGVLVVSAEEIQDGPVINLNFNDEDTLPSVEIYCGDKGEMKNVDIDVDFGSVTIEQITADALSVSTDYGDVDIRETAFEKGNVEMEAGDAHLTGIRSSGLTLNNDYGDCELAGAFEGKTEITMESGDLSFSTSVPEEKYAVSAQTQAGSLRVSDMMWDGYENQYTGGSGSHVLKILSDYGDVDVDFGNEQ